MKEFIKAIKDTFTKKTHHKGLPPTHTVTPVEEKKPEAAPPVVADKVETTAVTKKPHRKHKHTSKPRGKVAPVTDVEENLVVDAAPVLSAAEVDAPVKTKKPHRKHKHPSKPRGKEAPVAAIDENPITVPVSVVASKEITDVAVIEENPIAVPVSVVASKEITDVAVDSQPKAEEVPIAKVAAPRTKESAVVFMFGEKDAAKAEHINNIIEERQSKELIFSANGVDHYGLHGRLLPENPHRLEITSQGLHYLTTQEAVEEMNQNQQKPRGKVAPQYR